MTCLHIIFPLGGGEGGGWVFGGRDLNMRERERERDGEREGEGERKREGGFGLENGGDGLLSCWVRCVMLATSFLWLRSSG